MSISRRELGTLGERLAAEAATEAGLHIIARNWRDGRSGELDIIAADPDENCYAVIEVRTRIGNHCGSAFESVNWKKYQRLRKLARAWLSTQEVKRHVRIDVIAVDFDTSVRHLLDSGVSIDTLDGQSCTLRWVKGLAA